jgi:hypothetical protein
MSFHGKGETSGGDAPRLEFMRLRMVSGTGGEIGGRRVFVDTVELGNVTLVACVMRETIENDRRDRFTARDTLYGVLHAITELQVIGRSVLIYIFAPPIGDGKTIAE